jgi:hypothetical protein
MAGEDTSKARSHWQQGRKGRMVAVEKEGRSWTRKCVWGHTHTHTHSEKGHWGWREGGRGGGGHQVRIAGLEDFVIEIGKPSALANATRNFELRENSQQTTHTTRTDLVVARHFHTHRISSCAAAILAG